MQKKSKASILVFTLLIISIITILTQQLVRSVLIGYEFSSNQIAAQKARVLAVGGIKLAISQLKMDNIFSKENLEEKDGATEQQKLKDFLSRILPNINRWQVFNLKKDIDGVDGKLKFSITCENGKINLNKAFDFKKGEFNEKYKEFFKDFEVKNKLKPGELESKLKEFFKKREKPLNDISELTKANGLEKLGLFYRPPSISATRKKSSPNNEIYLQDLFTTWTDSQDLQLLFSSDSMLAAFGLRRPVADDKDSLKDKFKGFVQNFDKNWIKDWETNWQNFSPIFGKDIKLLKKYEKILSKEFGSKVYSVISCGIIENIEQRLLVVLKEVEIEKKEEKLKEGSAKEKISKKQKDQSPLKDFKIIRMYWL